MADAPSATPVTGAPAQPTAPSHHSHLQPRDTGRFAGPPQPGQPAQQAGETPAQAAERIRLQYRENGRDVSEELTVQELAELRRRARAGELHTREASVRLERADQLAQQARMDREALEAQRKAMLGDPNALTDFLRKNGGKDFNPMSFLTKALETLLSQEDMTPEQRELAQLKAERAEMEAERERQQQEQRAQDFNRQVTEKRAIWHQTLSAALDQHGLPATEEAIEAASRYTLSAMKQGLRVSPEQVAEYAKEQTFHHFGSLTKGMDGGAIKQRFPEVYRAVHQHLVAQVRGGGQQPQRSNTQPRPAARTQTQQQGGEKLTVYSTWD